MSSRGAAGESGGAEPVAIGARDVVVEVKSASSAVSDGSHSRSVVKRALKLANCGSSVMIQASFGVNFVLFGIKIYIFLISGSSSVLASLLDSSVDLLAQFVLMVSNRLADRPRHVYETLYPAGVARIEPIGVIVCSVVMSLGAMWMVSKCLMDFYSVYVVGQDMPRVELDVGSGVFLGALVVMKAVLWLWCSTLAGKGHVSLDAVAEDHRNDVASNSVAIVAAAVASRWAVLWAADPVGAVLISLWIIRAWCLMGKEQADLLVGKSADPKFLDVVRELAETHDPNATLDVVRAYHFGPKFLVEIELVMAQETPLLESHDVGILLQHKIENLDACERCFVHIDYQHRESDDHDPSVPLNRKTSMGEGGGGLSRRSPTGEGERDEE